MYVPNNMPREVSDYNNVLFDTISIQGTDVSTNPTTGSFTCAGGVGISGNLNVGGTIVGGGITYGTTSTGVLAVTDTPGTTLTVASIENSVSPITGAVVIDGGVGIGGNLNVQGTITGSGISYGSTSTGTLSITNSPGTTLTVASTQQSTDTISGAVVIDGGVGLGGNINSAGAIRTIDTTQSTNYTNGSMLTLGGIGAAGNINSGGTVSAPSYIVEYNNFIRCQSVFSPRDRLLGATYENPLPLDCTYLYTPGNSANASPDYVLGVNNKGLVIPAIVESVSPTTGSIITQGGVGISKNLNVLGETKIWSTNDSTSVSTGALAIAGGVGIAKKLNAFEIASPTVVGTNVSGTTSTFTVGNHTTTNSNQVNTLNMNVTGTATINSLNPINTINATTINATNVNTTSVAATGTITADTVLVNLVDTLNMTSNGTFNANIIRTTGELVVNNPHFVSGVNILKVKSGLSDEVSMGFYDNLDNLKWRLGNRIDAIDSARFSIGSPGKRQLEILESGPVKINDTLDTLGPVNIANATQAISKTTGALTVVGGIGTQGNIHCDRISVSTNGAFSTINCSTLDASTGNITTINGDTVNYTDINSTTGNITTVNSTDVNTGSLDASGTVKAFRVECTDQYRLFNQPYYYENAPFTPTFHGLTHNITPNLVANNCYYYLNGNIVTLFMFFSYNFTLPAGSSEFMFEVPFLDFNGYLPDSIFVQCDVGKSGYSDLKRRNGALYGFIGNDYTATLRKGLRPYSDSLPVILDDGNNFNVRAQISYPRN